MSLGKHSLPKFGTPRHRSLTSLQAMFKSMQTCQTTTIECVSGRIMSSPFEGAGRGHLNRLALFFILICRFGLYIRLLVERLSPTKVNRVSAVSLNLYPLKVS